MHVYSTKLDLQGYLLFGFRHILKSPLQHAYTKPASRSHVDPSPAESSQIFAKMLFALSGFTLLA